MTYKSKKSDNVEKNILIKLFEIKWLFSYKCLLNELKLISAFRYSCQNTVLSQAAIEFSSISNVLEVRDIGMVEANEVFTHYDPVSYETSSASVISFKYLCFVY